MATSREVAEVLGMLSSVYPHYNLTPETIKSYAILLSDIPVDTLKAAAIQCARTKTFFPSVSELVSAAYDFIDDDTTPEEAWGIVVKHMSRPMTTYHAGKKLKLKPLSDRIERAVTAIGGWPVLRASENYVADRARFIDAYRGLKEREKRQATEHPQITALKAKQLPAKKLLKGE